MPLCAPLFNLNFLHLPGLQWRIKPKLDEICKIRIRQTSKTFNHWAKCIMTSTTVQVSSTIFEKMVRRNGFYICAPETDMRFRFNIGILNDLVWVRLRKWLVYRLVHARVCRRSLFEYLRYKGMNRLRCMYIFRRLAKCPKYQQCKLLHACWTKSHWY